MPLQNRVTPFGEIISTPERGMFTGNRGIIHDAATRTLLARRWTTRAWIVCRCAFNGRRRQVMGPGSWTELFFLDEATALAAGHRPCFECRRAEAQAFRAAFARGRGEPEARAADMDRVLHAERLIGRGKRLHSLPGPLTALPDGVMAAAGADAFLVLGGRTLKWSPGGYVPDAPSGELMLLTPPSTVRTLASGYRPLLHPSAEVPSL